MKKNRIGAAPMERAANANTKVKSNFLIDLDVHIVFDRVLPILHNTGRCA